jgi:hypothetical protein
MRKPLVIALAVVAICVAVIVWLQQSGTATDHPPAPAAAQRTSSTAVPSASAPAERITPPRHVQRLDPAARQQLAAQIAAARARARSSAAPTPRTPDVPADTTITLEQVSSTVQDALKEAIPILAECYAQGSSTQRTAAVQMIMISDPEVGTVIDTEAIRDGAGQPLASALDDCLRTTIESLGLPPLLVGGRLPLQYSFVFDGAGSVAEPVELGAVPVEPRDGGKRADPPVVPR